ncbi:MAG: cyclic nucleotide-binding domain-containing protein [Gammaproteobacteria bacterium]|nr:cyclic nucleotide-binding domain-containing protein [Gammaproteobacteria bacterium]MBU1656341.1 cyclic nucleotide-binding domain-containing protein [Gammaproteobacteria bacterium]MBU1959906.1 cyclic nucleotide-binding domain-containing protein [Gammaproteobacteria bacterium]
MGDVSRIDPKLLKRLIPLNTLSDHGFQSILTHAEVFTAKKGTRLFKQGDTEQFHFYLLAGQVRLEVDGLEQECLDGRDEAAKFPIAHQLPRKYTARALDKIRFLRLDSQFLGTILANSSGSDYEVSELNHKGGDEEEDWMTQVLRSRIFQLIPPSNIQRVLMHMEEYPVSAGDLVYRQGEEGDYFYMINRGRCRVERDMNDGSPPIELGELGPGAGFGEESLITGERRNSTVTVLEKGRLVRLSKAHFNEQVKSALARPYAYPEARKAVAEGAVWLDVREPEEFDKGHLSDAINIPFSLLRYQAESLDPERKYIICCENGRTSPAAAFQLTDQGLDVTVLDQGLAGVPGDDLQRSEMDAEEVESAAQIDLHEIEQEAELGHVPGDASTERLQRLELVAQAASKLKGYALRLERDKRRLEEKRIKEVRVLREALEKAHKQRVKMERHYLAQKKEDETLRVALDRARSETERLKASEDEQAKTRSQLAEKDAELARLRANGKELEAVRAQLAQARREVEQLNARIAAAGAETRQLNSLRTELAEAQAALGNEVSAMESAEQQLFEMEKREEVLRGQLEGIENERAMEERRAGELEKSNRSLQEQLNKAKLELSEAEQRTRGQSIELENLRSRKEQLGVRLENETAGRIAAEEQLSIVEKRAENQRGQLEQAGRQRDLAEQKVNSLAMELENLRSTMEQFISQLEGDPGDVDQIAALTAELEMVRTHSEEEAMGYRDKIDRLEQEIRQLRK